MAANDNFYALGRRKSATARVRLGSSKNKGTITVNGQPYEQYFAASKYLQSRLFKAFNVLELDAENFNVSVLVSGGGHAAQVDAIRLGISKALVAMNEDFKGSLKRAELLGRDPREKERKKFGLRSARKRRQFTKR